MLLPVEVMYCGRDGNSPVALNMAQFDEVKDIITWTECRWVEDMEIQQLRGYKRAMVALLQEAGCNILKNAIRCQDVRAMALS